MREMRSSKMRPDHKYSRFHTILAFSSFFPSPREEMIWKLISQWRLDLLFTFALDINPGREMEERRLESVTRKCSVTRTFDYLIYSSLRPIFPSKRWIHFRVEIKTKEESFSSIIQI